MPYIMNMPMFKTPVRTLFIFLIALIFGATQAVALPILRDTEIEETLRLYADPILYTAGLNAKTVHIIIINRKDLNAFVANGQNINIFAGLLMEAETPEEVIGVIAHETGHISGGHLARIYDQVDKFKNTTIASLVLGAAVGILSGRPGAAAAIVRGGQETARRSFLSHSRSQEESADQAALSFLDELQYSSRGMLTFMKRLEGKSFLISRQTDDYLSTHPAISERVRFIKNHVETSPLSNKKLPADFYLRHKRMRAKLDGFLLPPVETLRKYDPTDPGVDAIYARAIAYFRAADLDEALRLIDKLITRAPNDPYFLELKGQMLFENGKIPEAVVAYQKAVNAKPNAPLLRVGLAQAQLAVPAENLYNQALAHLKMALNRESKNSFGWRLMSIAYGQKGDIGMANLSLAESFMLIGKKKEALQKAGIAKGQLKEKSPSWYRANDIISQAKESDL